MPDINFDLDDRCNFQLVMPAFTFVSLLEDDFDFKLSQQLVNS
jgi:hypothetical protein